MPGEFFDGAASYFVTAYTVDPDVICSSGRSEDEFLEQGSGNTVVFQQSADPTDLMVIPLTTAEMAEQWDGVWYEHNCFLNMGVHYFNFNYDPNQDCQEAFPFQAS